MEGEYAGDSWHERVLPGVRRAPCSLGRAGCCPDRVHAPGSEVNRIGPDGIQAHVCTQQQLRHDATVVSRVAEGQLLIDFLDGIVGCGAQRRRPWARCWEALHAVLRPASPQHPQVSLLLCRVLGIDPGEGRCHPAAWDDCVAVAQVSRYAQGPGRPQQSHLPGDQNQGRRRRPPLSALGCQASGALKPTKASGSGPSGRGPRLGSRGDGLQSCRPCTPG